MRWHPGADAGTAGCNGSDDRGLRSVSFDRPGAVEAIDAIRDAFRRDAVDISIAGDVEDVEIALGLRAGRATPAPKYMVLPTGGIPWLDAGSVQQNARASPRSAKVGRNDRCPCGSGKKYKKCCLP